MRGLSPRMFARIAGTYFLHSVDLDYQDGELNRKPNWVRLGTFNGRHLRVSRTSQQPMSSPQTYDSVVIVAVPEPIPSHPDRNQKYKLTVREFKGDRDQASLEVPEEQVLKSTTYFEVVDFRVLQDVAGNEFFWELRANHARAVAGQ